MEDKLTSSSDILFANVVLNNICRGRGVGGHLVLVVSVQLLLPSGIVSQLMFVFFVKLYQHSAEFPTLLIATHLSASDSLRP